MFGSARISRESPYYETCAAISAALAGAGFAIIAGGGPGIMEAANKGAFEAGGTSVGLNISLPHEAHNNEYQTISLSFEYFYSRKATFFMHSMAYVAMPGGFGTLDELFEALTLIQTGKVPPAPIVLVGSEFWHGLVDWLGEQLLANGMIAAHDLNLFIIEDDPAKVVRKVVEFHDKQGRTDSQHAPSLPA
ncbi:TIGR00730 family Rossman fold protein [Bordetella parapertussis]|uniref:Cytokinin riboside 5'-monophosphate phosphoribohydrolase n=2 Tax=Bordetella parapertussis TaxID=519 RepID=Q7W9A0_BORPA|nr:Rossman fold protein, TIGR00730 family [Bordetella parapertussis]AWP65347.1 Rossman fold protein, TIGR00730 family [Bordetella parapertussis]AWP72853.1 Rossman fold protein, TIGR00730 family [Bordetella parapertussis]AWP91429.1 Rossman fold protein, TIGR00730 family [Bordetella parapertussis]AWP98926.1 Rossman fold protein, TIGR00730 family [Bordetella parapertussis]